MTVCSSISKVMQGLYHQQYECQDTRRSQVHTNTGARRAGPTTKTTCSLASSKKQPTTRSSVDFRRQSISGSAKVILNKLVAVQMGRHARVLIRPTAEVDTPRCRIGLDGNALQQHLLNHSHVPRVFMQHACAASRERRHRQLHAHGRMFSQSKRLQGWES